MGRPALLTERVAAVAQQEGAVPEPAAVHEMRVAARRLRAALRLLRVREFDPAVKALQDALGQVRDLQLEADWLRGRDAALERARRARLRKAERVLTQELRKWHSRTLPALLERAADESAPSPRKVSKMLRKRLARLEERLEIARARLTPQPLHRARVSVKQVRYLLDVARDSLPKRVAALESDLKTLQASLGEIHDVDVRIGLVRGRPALLRDQREARRRLCKVAAAQLSRWHKQRLVERVSAVLR
jgi:CHAD domain-containing protein